MATVKIDAVGLKCPQPVLKIAAKSPDMQPGDVMEVSANCPTFEKDVKAWCDRMKKVLMWVRKEGDKTVAQIQF